MTVEQIVGKIFSVDPADVRDHCSRHTVSEWDSMGHLTLIMELEARFKVTISIADAVEMADVRKIKETLRRYGVDC